MCLKAGIVAIDIESVLMRCKFPGGLVREDPVRKVYFITQYPGREIVWKPQGRESEHCYNMLAFKDFGKRRV